MIIVREIEPGTFERLTGNPKLLRLDGEVKAPLQTIMAPSWSAEDRAQFGVYIAEPFVVPEGMMIAGSATYERRGDTVVELRPVEAIPRPTVKQVASDMVEASKAIGDDAIAIIGLDYPVAISGGQITIACESHTAAEWAAFDDRTIAEMDGTNGARFWAEYRDMILKLARAV